MRRKQISAKIYVKNLQRKELYRIINERRKSAARKTPKKTIEERCPRWPKEHDWKSCIPPKGIVGSNPTLSAKSEPIRTLG